MLDCGFVVPDRREQEERAGRSKGGQDREGEERHDIARSEPFQIVRGDPCRNRLRRLPNERYRSWMARAASISQWQWPWTTEEWGLDSLAPVSTRLYGNLISFFPLALFPLFHRPLSAHCTTCCPDARQGLTLPALPADSHQGLYTLTGRGRNRAITHLSTNPRETKGPRLPITDARCEPVAHGLFSEELLGRHN